MRRLVGESPLGHRVMSLVMGLRHESRENRVRGRPG